MRLTLVKGGKISLPASFEIPSPSSTTFTPIPRRSDRSAKFLETTTLTRFLIHWRGNLGFWIRDVKRNRVCAAAFPGLIDYYFIYSPLNGSYINFFEEEKSRGEINQSL